MAGVVVDRLDHRHVQLAGTAVRVLLLAGMAWLAFADRLNMPLLIEAVAVCGVTQVFVDLAGSSIIPQLRPPRSRLSAANSRVMGMEQVTNTFLGAPVGGFLLVLGSGWLFGVPVALGLGFLLVVGLGLRGSYRVEADPEETASTRVAHVLEGIRFQLTHPVLRPLVITGSTVNFASTGYFAVFVLWVVGPGSRVGLEPQESPLLLLVPVLSPDAVTIGAAFFLVGVVSLAVVAYVSTAVSDDLVRAHEAQPPVALPRVLPTSSATHAVHDVQICTPCTDVRTLDG